jgi:hypothetical protein
MRRTCTLSHLANGITFAGKAGLGCRVTNGIVYWNVLCGIKLKDGSPCLNKGADVGVTLAGKAPALGAFSRGST